MAWISFCHSPVNFCAHSRAYPCSLALTPARADAGISTGEWQQPLDLIHPSAIFCTWIATRKLSKFAVIHPLVIVCPSSTCCWGCQLMNHKYLREKTKAAFCMHSSSCIQAFQLMQGRYACKLSIIYTWEHILLIHTTLTKKIANLFIKSKESKM